MKRYALTILTLLAILTTQAAENQIDTVVMNRMYAYLDHYSKEVNGFSTNVYIKHLYQIHKRSATLYVVPSMYTLAYGQRAFVSEEYNKFTFKEVGEYDNKRQVYCTTIPRNRRAMSVLLKYLTPNFYDVTIYDDHVLSPFSRENRVYYQFSTVQLANHQVRLYFRPRIVRNTQLVRGKAIIDERTGRIEQVEMEGEFDMIRFQTLTMMGDEGGRALLPKICQTSISFKFGGNHVTSQFEAIFDCPITLPDSVNVKGDRLLMDSIRPISLSKDEQAVYEDYDRRHGLIADVEEEEVPELDSLMVTKAWIKEDDLPQEPSRPHHNYLKEIGWDIIGDNLIHSLRTESERGYVKLSPILDPQYISFSESKGFSYRIKLGAEYHFSNQSYVKFNPYIGYNFKFQEFYYRAPLLWHYSDELDADFELVVGNNNRIGSQVILDEIKQEYGDLPELEGKELDLFDDEYIRLQHNIRPRQWLWLETGFIFHYRKAVNPSVMQQFGKDTQYYSLAPLFSVKFRPWEKAPMFTIDYERGLKVNDHYTHYERWEADASIMHKLPRTQLLNVRIGGGLYTARGNDRFMDFSNFRDNNLPGGWDDDWAGNFQLLKSRFYNESKYYLRGNISFETPLMAGYLVPIVGRYVERERLYLSSLSIQHTRMYSELGYGFTCRFFSLGLFTSFLNYEYQDMGCKFTFELFRRW